MEYITNNTLKKIYSKLKISDIESQNFQVDLIDINSILITQIKNTFNNPEQIIIEFYHKSANRYNSISDEDIEYATYHSKEDCKILKSDYNYIDDNGIEQIIVNSGSIMIENSDLAELKIIVNFIIDMCVNGTKNHISKEDVMMIMFRFFHNGPELEFSNELLKKHESEISNYLDSLNELFSFDLKKIFSLYFKIIFNKLIPFERNLFSHLNIKFCLGDCGVEMAKNRREKLLGNIK